MQEMLPGESAAGSYVFSIRDGCSRLSLYLNSGATGISVVDRALFCEMCRIKSV